MDKIMLTRAQREVLRILTRRDLQAIRKNPQLVSSAKQLALACRKIIRKVESLPKYCSRKKRETANGRIVKIARKALDEAGLK